MQRTDSRGTPRIPSLLRHKSGRAFARVHRDGRAHETYFGKYGSLEARRAYADFVAALLGGEDVVPAPRQREVVAAGPSIDELIILYKTERLAGRSDDVKEKADLSLRELQRMFGMTPAAEFGPRLLADVRRSMAKTGRLNRREINRRVQGITKFFRWAVAQQYVPADTAHALAALDALRRGEIQGLREPRVVRPVDRAVVDATCEKLPVPLRAVVEVMWWSGARACEVLQARPCDIDRSQVPWRFTPQRHKTQNHGKTRTIFLGPNAQAAIGPLVLRCASPEEFVFKPADTITEKKRQRRAGRRSKLTPSQRARDQATIKNPKLELTERYDTVALNQAIRRAVFAVNAPKKIVAMRETLHELLPDRSAAIERACSRLSTRMPAPALDRLAKRACGDEHEGRVREVRTRLQEIRDTPGDLPTWSCHRLRHAAASRLEEGCHDHEAVRATLGHSSIETTRAYVKLDERRAAALMAELG